MWADTLTTEEVDVTLEAARLLSAVPWAAPLLDGTKPILDRLRAGVTDRETYRKNPLRPAEMSFLFEIRFARSLAMVGLDAAYEHGAGVGNSSVDFRVDLDPPWLVELVSLHESDGFKAAAWRSGAWQGFALHTGADDARQSEEGETLKAQERIGAKVFDRKQGPIKFPAPGAAINMVMVDARGFLGDGGGDQADWHQIAYGPHGLEDHFVKQWTNPTTGVRAPIKGLFEPGCPLLAAGTAQARLHIIGFVCERSFAPDEIKEKSFYCCNPALFENEEAARTAMARWPLRRTATGPGPKSSVSPNRSEIPC
jgi:hypothetical protein